MRQSFLSTVLSAALLSVAGGLIPAQAADVAQSETPVLPWLSPSQVAQTETDIQAILSAGDGALDEAVDRLLANGVTPDMADAIGSALDRLAQTDPAKAAEVAATLAAACLDLATTTPQAAVDLADAVARTALSPSVRDANPDAAGTAIGDVAGALRLAARAAQTEGLTLVRLDVAQARLESARDSNPEIAALIDDAIDLADAQADLAGFATAAGGPAAGTGGGGGATGGVPAGIGGGGGGFGGGGAGPVFVTVPGGGGGLLTDQIEASPT